MGAYFSRDLFMQDWINKGYSAELLKNELNGDHDWTIQMDGLFVPLDFHNRKKIIKARLSSNGKEIELTTQWGSYGHIIRPEWLEWR